jgi:glucan 1,3-beta-glucosidase
MEKIRGVNLGNWLVLEKWMHPPLFHGVDAEDETDLCLLLSDDEKKGRLKAHRDSYITEYDFRYIKNIGMNIVRLPVPHFVFGDRPEFCEPYVPCIEYVDKAFEWAKKTGLKVLIDLHTAPDSQNGFDKRMTLSI